MSGYKNSPVLSKDKPYERYVVKIHTWCIVTELDIKKQGVAIALSLPVIGASILYFARHCPHKRYPVEEKMTLFVGPKNEEMCLFTSEAKNSAVLNAGCTSTVAGKNWIIVIYNHLI